jgi:hypothetical protein
MDLIYLACWEKKKFFISGIIIECERGQLAWSQLKLSERWKCSRQNVRTFLNNLEKDSMIIQDFIQKSNHKNMIITICNYSEYQDIQPQKQPLANHKPTTSQPLANPIQEILEVIEVLENTTTDVVVSAKQKKQATGKQFLLDLGVAEKLANDFIILRKSKKAALSESACDILKNEADKAGITVTQAVEICIGRNWQNFNASWDWQNSKPINVSAYKTREQLRQEGTDRAREAFLASFKTIDSEAVK